MFVNIVVYMVIPSWHIPYSMKPWLSYSNKGFYGGFIKKSHSWGLDYMDVGKHYINGGGYGGVVNSP